MIVEFTAKNFRSFKDAATLSLRAAPLRSERSVVTETGTGDLLPVIGIFGPNASGKSNLIKALSFVRSAVRNTDALNRPTTQHDMLRPFLLDKHSSKDPSFFEIVLWDEERDSEYKYGFEINEEAIVNEWLEVTSKESKQRRSRIIFSREGQTFNIHKSMNKELRPKSADVPATILALAHFANTNSDLPFRVVSLLGKPNLVLFDGANEMSPRVALERCRKDPVFKKKVLSLLEQAGMGIKDFVIDEVEIPKDVLKLFSAEFKKQMKQDGHKIDGTTIVSTAHKVRPRSPKDKETYVTFNLQHDESLGTQRFLGLASLVIESLEKGSVFVLDELGASLHPFLTSAIVKLFQNKKTNKKNAQFIFCSHETYLLSKHSNLRRDQIWFTDINFYEESSLHSLIEYNTRNDIEVAKNYLEKRFAAVPDLDSFEI